MRSLIQRIFPNFGYTPTRKSLILRGTVYLAFFAVAVALAVVVTQGKFVKQTKLVAEVNDAGGSLVAGSDVKARGVVIGRVTSLTREGVGVVHIHMDLNPRQAAKIPTNSVVRVLPATVFGTAYLDIEIPDAANAQGIVKSGSLIHQDMSKPTLELQQDLDDIDRILKTVQPAELASTLGALAEAVDGKGEELGRTIDSLDSYLTKITGQLPVLRSDLADLATNLRNVRDAAPELLDAVDAGLTTAATIANKQNQLAAFLTGGGQFVGDLNTMLSANQQKLVGFLQTFSVPVQALNDSRNQFTPVLLSLGDFARAAGTAVRPGWINIDAYVVTSNRSYYTNADCPRYGSLAGRNC